VQSEEWSSVPVPVPVPVPKPEVVEYTYTLRIERQGGTLDFVLKPAGELWVEATEDSGTYDVMLPAEAVLKLRKFLNESLEPNYYGPQYPF